MILKEVYKVFEYFKDHPPDQPPEYVSTYEVEHEGRTTQLRFDYEIAEGETEEYFFNRMFGGLAAELTFILFSGDITHHYDPVLKTMDGRARRGVQLQSFLITWAKLKKEYRPDSGVYDYTMWVVFEAKWEDGTIGVEKSDATLG